VSPHPTLAATLRTLRLAADLTLEGLAERSGISARTISDLERGVSAAPQRRTAAAIARGLGLDAAATDGFLRAARARRRAPSDAPRVAAIAPNRLADFTGRDREIDDIGSLLVAPSDAAVSPLVIVLCGPPGIGKTTSAFEALSRARTVWPRLLYVDLDGFSSMPLTPLQVLRALLRQLPGLTETLPTSLAAAARLWQSVTAEDPPAVLLDNAATESQIRPVLSLDARSVVLITSRRSLAGLEGVRRMTLGPLGADDSVLLLSRLIPADQREGGDLLELAALAGHVPLALRIAGNRIASHPGWTTADFVVRMRSAENRLRLLVAGDLAVEAAFALSYDDLDAQNAALFRSIAVIDGATFDARIAAAVMAADVLDTEARLDELTDLGLVEARGGNRYRLHDLIRLYALTALRAEDGTIGVAVRRDRLRTWLLSRLERAGAWFEPDRVADDDTRAGASFPDADTAQAWIRLEVVHWWPALRAAATVGDHAVVVDVADALHWFSDLWIEWGHWHEFFSLAVVSARALADPRLEAIHLGYVAWAEIVERGDARAAVVTAGRAVAAADAADDDTQRGWSQYYLAWAHMVLREFDESAAAGRVSVAAFNRAGNPDGAAQAMVMIGKVHADRGDHDLSIRDFEAVLGQVALTTGREDDLVLKIIATSAHRFITTSLLALDRPVEAVASATTALTLAQEIDSAAFIASALRVRVIAQIAAGEVSAAERDIERALAGIASSTKDAYINEQRTQLEALRRSLAAGANPEPAPTSEPAPTTEPAYTTGACTTRKTLLITGSASVSTQSGSPRCRRIAGTRVSQYPRCRACQASSVGDSCCANSRLVSATVCSSTSSTSTTATRVLAESTTAYSVPTTGSASPVSS
jgi:transcriptional regulator with XRE-family HTH domain